jgi:DtxR family Mn-dependent transcriptional regulator
VSNLAADKPISASVGDYLKALWSVAGQGTASTKDLSERLSVAPASVSNMLLRLQKSGFVDYEPYHGASLTKRGHSEAVHLVRRHRLIETFLLDQLGYRLTELHEEAESLEHAVSETFTERLAELLGYPQRDPHGDPIPTTEGTLEEQADKPLSQSRPTSRVRISRVEHRDSAMLAHIAELGLVPGKELRIVESRKLDGVVLVEDEEGASHIPLAESILATEIS